MKNLKSLQRVIKARRAFSQSEIDEIISDVYDAEGNVLCVDAQHIEDGSDGYSYTWYIPCNMPQDEIQLGDILDVEISIFPYHAKVKVTREPYQKTMLMHRKDIHPYCKVNRVIERDNELLFRIAENISEFPFCQKFIDLQLNDDGYINTVSKKGNSQIYASDIMAEFAPNSTKNEFKLHMESCNIKIFYDGSIPLSTGWKTWEELSRFLGRIETVFAEIPNLSQRSENRAYVEAWNNQD